MNLKATIRKYQLRFGFTLVLILSEAGLSILFPLFIGYAIDDVIEGSHYGAIKLGVLGLVVLVVGMGRRVYDSRFYAKVYQDMGSQTLSHINSSQASVKSARLGMVRELIEFLENSLPELIHNLIGLIGVIGILATLNLQVFYGSLLVTLLIFLIFGFSSKKTVALNKASNDEMERQVDVISSNKKEELTLHLQHMMKWNIKLSDLEAMNFSFSWLVLIGFLILSILVSAGERMVTYGVLFSLIMYVFQYMENVLNLPLFYQNWLRLKEIRHRLEDAVQGKELEKL